MAFDDPDAFAAFYRENVRSLTGFFLHRTNDPELAMDLAAETFAEALAGRRRFDARKGTATMWLYGIARHKLARALERGRVEDSARRKLKMAPLVLDDEALERVEATRDGRAVELLSGLPEEQRSAVSERVLEERGYEEMAARARTSEAVIRKRVSRGLAGLRNQIEEPKP
jgi:RNA polymerase sigma-70 factor (ECF subfamily)